MSRQKSSLRIMLEPLVIAIVLAAALRAVAKIYVVPSASMTPTLLEGDHVVATDYLFGQAPSRGDIIVFESPLSPGAILVKRVIGIPGDLVESRLGHVLIGGHTLAEPYLMTQTATGGISPLIVPAETFYVLGDNRTNSSDSRVWGPLPARMVVGRARLVLWSSRARGDAGRAAAPRPLRFLRPLR